jgi:hypothetical protein
MFFLTFATLCAAWPLLWHCWHTRSEVGQAWFGLGSGSGSGHNSLNSCFFGLEKFTIQAGLLSGLGFTKQMKIVELKSVLCNKPDPPLHLLRNPQFYFRIVCCWLRTEERLRKKSADIILGSTCHWLKKVIGHKFCLENIRLKFRVCASQGDQMSLQKNRPKCSQN